MENNDTRKLGMRKGAWTKEEDLLLRDCIRKYGEGKWHLVPLRAGNLTINHASSISNKLFYFFFI